VLFKNDKGGIESRADYRGKCEIGGVKYWIDAWINISKDHEKFMSIRFKPADVARAPAVSEKTRQDFNDDIPF